MEKEVQVHYKGRPVPGYAVAPISSEEHFNIYMLEDGSVIKMKAVVVSFYRLKNERDDAGRPVYVMNMQNIIDVLPGEGL